ncbi:LysR family transcriptional regulator [Salipiger abyssi]|uniref:LysR family transcriptional regulator n=1 Tax=Salipiger abyssi TaxID=1250539 RepID=UPI001A8E651D|nr:LysR family transcriptional regulator [Salipiger abyssi]MBN9888689.1 LysR family transcriptional regulator [Salipiger abyssi]
MDRNLLSFIAVARLGTMSAAADALAITQPALTKRLQLLEQQFGTPLLERHSRGVTLTESGQQLLYYALRIRSEYQQARERLDAMSDRPPEVLRIASGPFFLFRHLGQAIVEMRKRHPGIRVVMESNPEGSNLDKLRDGELDVVFGDRTEAHSLRTPFDFVFLPITVVNIGLLVSAASPLARHAPLRPEDLTGVPWVEYSGTPDYRMLVRGYFMSRGLIPPEMVIETGSFFLGSQIVEHSDAVMMAPKELFPSLQQPGLSFVETDPLMGRMETGAFLRKSSQQHAVIAEFVDSIARRAAAEGPGTPLDHTADRRQ